MFGPYRSTRIKYEGKEEFALAFSHISGGNRVEWSFPNFECTRVYVGYVIILATFGDDMHELWNSLKFHAPLVVGDWHSAYVLLYGPRVLEEADVAASSDDMTSWNTSFSWKPLLLEFTVLWACVFELYIHNPIFNDEDVRNIFWSATSAWANFKVGEQWTNILANYRCCVFCFDFIVLIIVIASLFRTLVLET